jgi:hypothetical protein
MTAAPDLATRVDQLEAAVADLRQGQTVGLTFWTMALAGDVRDLRSELREILADTVGGLAAVDDRLARIEAGVQRLVDQIDGGSPTR